MFPQDWDVCHSDNHWCNEDTMKQYIEKIIVPFISEKREALKLERHSPALAIFDCFNLGSCWSSLTATL